MDQQRPHKWHTKNTFSFKEKEKQIIFTSQFDTGNLYSVKKECNTYIVTPALDSYNTEVTSKTFFHFRAEGFQKQQISIKIQPVAVLIALQKTGNLEAYRPWIKYGNNNYERMSQKQVKVFGEDIITISIRFTPKQNNFYLSFAEPYSFQRYINLVQRISPRSNIYYSKQILCHSLQKRPIYILNITSNQNNILKQKFDINQNNLIFPEHDISNIVMNSKTTIIITARVHPGQSTSSFALEGILQFLLSNDLRAHILRKLFNFLIIPMLNPDGVFNGFYRTDTMANNLNRFYSIANQNQPSIFCVKSLIQFYSSKKKLLFFFDLHGHPSYKGSFLYGNYMQYLSQQSEAFLFTKLLALNCSTFSLTSCNFNKTQMTAKDRPSELSKQGSGRVFAYKISNIPHSFTVQFGMYSSNQVNQLAHVSNQNFKLGEYSYIHSPNIVKILSNQGVAILISILDLLQLNPYSRINNGILTAKQMRKNNIKDTYQKLDRFRLIQKISTAKILTFAKTMEDSFSRQINMKWMNFLPWPQCVKIKRGSRISSCIVNPRPSQPTIQEQTIQTQQIRMNSTYQAKQPQTARGKDNSLRTSLQKIKQSNTLSVDNSTTKGFFKQQLRQKIQIWTQNINPHYQGQSPPSKTRIKYKRLLLIQKQSQPQRKDYAKMVQINFDQFRLQPQSQTTILTKLPKTSSKLIKKQQQFVKFRIPSRSMSKASNQMYQNNLLMQKQRQTIRKSTDFKLASLLQTADKYSQVYSDQKIRTKVPDKKDIKLERFIKSFKQKRFSKI